MNAILHYPLCITLKVLLCTLPVTTSVIALPIIIYLSYSITAYTFPSYCTIPHTSLTSNTTITPMPLTPCSPTYFTIYTPYLSYHYYSNTAHTSPTYCTIYPLPLLPLLPLLLHYRLQKRRCHLGIQIPLCSEMTTTFLGMRTHVKHAYSASHSAGITVVGFHRAPPSRLEQC